LRREAARGEPDDVGVDCDFDGGVAGASSGRQALTASAAARACCQVPGASWRSRRRPGIQVPARRGLADGVGGVADGEAHELAQMVVQEAVF